MTSRPVGWPAALLLGCLLAASTRPAPVAAQQAASRADATPGFVSDAQALSDLEASGFLDSAEAEQFASQEDLGAGADGQADSFGLLPEAASGELPRLKFKATAISAYEPAPIAATGAMGLGCGFGHVDPDFRGAYIGVGSSVYSRGFACGRCVEIQCDDKGCLEAGGTIVAQVVDLCGDCYNADISLAIPAFANLTGAEPSINPTLEARPACRTVSWDYVDCAPLIEGNIWMLVKEGGNAYYQAFNFANARVPITAVQINGERLKHGTSNWWEWNPGNAIDPRGPFNIALLGSNREVLRVRVTKLKNLELAAQFGRAASGQ